MTAAVGFSPWTGIADHEELEHWRRIATSVAETLARDALERDRAGRDPSSELDLLRSSGLVNLLIPSHFGGGGGHWESAFLAVRIIARADGSIAQVLAYHYINSAGIGFNLPEAEQEEWFRRSASEQWIWGDSVNPVDPDLEFTPAAEGFRLNGLKRFSTGASAGDVVLVSARISEGPEHGEFRYAVLEHGRLGIHYLGDWDSLGQRLSASGSVSFSDVEITPADVLGPAPNEDFASLVTPAIQLAFGNLYLGIAEGALAQGTDLLRARTNAWFLSAAEKYRHDPLVQRTVGEFVSRLAALEALAERVNRRFDEAISLGSRLDAVERGRIAIEVARLKVVADETALDVAHRIFEVTGSSSAQSRTGLDIYWRNIRTHSLHDPVDYKKLEVGAHHLNGELQPISLYT